MPSPHLLLRAHRRWSGVGKAGHSLDPAVWRQRGKVGTAQIKRRLVRATRFPGKAHEIVVCFDPADQVDAVTWELRLCRSEHGVDRAVTGAATMGVDVAAVLGQCPDDEIAATLRVLLVPCGNIADDGFVDVGHVAFSWL